ncbi:SOS response-associated peptidase [Rhizobium sp. KVB221]|uniref:Abasic site processing protein n=1 Tax=Rhizobium setariae TaxID=2801340 RepID=A0A936YUI6_9HYPH|nr:SOS response-associated peptidase [Rhizobium setariae]MBL0375416.1 SOS response-associated peptidase [Rhizobium setariae]
MCGRFTQFLPWSELVKLYRLTDPYIGRNTPPRYNIAPTQTVPFVRLDKEGNQVVDDGRWGLVPFYVKDKVPPYATFNARIETVNISGTFKHSFAGKRCLIPADGFYEWTEAEDKAKDPWFIHLPETKPFSFAGLWAYNDALDITSCTIITAQAIEPMTMLHGRMPVILNPEVYDAWLSPDTEDGELKTLLLRHNIDHQLEFHRVSRDVNSSRFAGDPGVTAAA